MSRAEHDEALEAVAEILGEARARGMVIDELDAQGNPITWLVHQDGTREQLFPPPDAPRPVRLPSVPLSLVVLWTLGALLLALAIALLLDARLG